MRRRERCDLEAAVRVLARQAAQLPTFVSDDFEVSLWSGAPSQGGQQVGNWHTVVDGHALWESEEVAATADEPVALTHVAIRRDGEEHVVRLPGGPKLMLAGERCELVDVRFPVSAPKRGCELMSADVRALAVTALLLFGMYPAIELWPYWAQCALTAAVWLVVMLVLVGVPRLAAPGRRVGRR